MKHRLLAISALSFCLALLIPTDSPRAEESKPTGPKNQREAAARRALNTGQNQKVIELLNPYTDQLSVPAYLDLANAYGNLNDVENEVRILRILNDRDKGNFESHFVLGQGLLKLRNETKVENKSNELETELVTAFRETIKLNVEYKPVYDSLLNYFVSANLNYEARQLLTQMINQFGERPELLNDQCRLYSIDGYLNQTIDHCKQAIAKSKNYPDNYVYLGQAHIEKGDDAKGGKIIRLAAKRFPQAEIAQWATGKYYFDKGNFPVSTRYFKRAVQANPNQDRSQLGLGKSLYEEKNHKAALQHLLKACQLNQAHKEVLLVSATDLRLKKKSTLADDFKRASYSCVKPQRR
jgi:thioredoxin-like negative regulator of GroEL